MRKILAHFLILALLVTMVGPLESFVSKRRVNAEFDDGGVRASTIHTDDRIQLEPLMSARVEGTPAAYETEATFLSEIFVPDFTFDSLALEWEEVRPEGTALQIWVRFQDLNDKWGEWADANPDIDFKDGTEDLYGASRLINTNRSQSFQYKVEMKSESGKVTPRVQNMQFHYIDATIESTISTEEKSPEIRPRLTFATDSVDMISREEWDADEDWRLASYFGMTDNDFEIEVEEEPEGDDTDKNGDEPSLQELYPEEFELSETITKENDEYLYWPLSYAENTDKIIIHHTATTKDLDNPEAAIRSIYYYHSVRRGWGDIGYNYIIDPEGNIYEGRAGGDGVVGGHARGYNTGSIGIAILGNYQDSEVPYAVLESLAMLIHEKAELHRIDVDGFSQFRGEVSANVAGHKDVGSTLCPGQNLYDMLPTLRKVVAGNMLDFESTLLTEGTDDPYAFANTNPYDALVMDPEETGTFTLELKNLGTETWTDETYLVANKNSNAEALVHIMKDETNDKSIAYMQEKSVASGETATFIITAEAMLRGGFESFDVTPIFSGYKKTSHYLNLPVYVSAPTLTYDLVELNVDDERMESGENMTVELEIENTGNVDWHQEGNYPLSLWIDGVEVDEVVEETIAPGEFATFEFTFTAPQDASHYTKTLIPTLEGLGALEGEAITFDVLVYNRDVQATYAGSSIDNRFEPGEQKVAWMDLENTGYLTWKRTGDDAFNMGTIKHPSIGVTKPALDEYSVDPGESTRVEFTITAPQEPGDYRIYFRPRLGKQNLTQKPFYYNFTVTESVSTFVSTYTQDDGLDQETIRIKLSTDGLAPEITADGNFYVYLGDELFFDLEKGDEVEVKKRDDRYQVTYDAYAWIVDEPLRFVPKSEFTIMEITNHENRPAWNTSLNDNRYRGTLEVRQVDGELMVINELPMEMYLRGIAESLNSDPVEKIRTMAIVARTYARYYLTKEEKFPGKPYHLDDDPDVSQKYLGYGFEARADNIVQAVEDTAGMVITYDGEIIKTPYFSSTDGTATRSAYDVWGWTHTPYLQSVPDELCDSDAFSGHGVGLSGCGTSAAAIAGKTFEEIIKYYYTGVDIEVK